MANADSSSADSIAVLSPYLVPLSHYFKERPQGFLDIHIHVTGHGIASESETKYNGSAEDIVDKKAQKDLSARSSSHHASRSSSPVIIPEIREMLGTSTSRPYTTHDGRPSVPSYLTSLVAESAKDAAIGVAVCGPAGLCDDAREATRLRMGGDQQLVFSEEGFTW